MSYFKSSLKKVYHFPYIRRLLTRIYVTFTTPPYKSHDMELKYGLWRGVSSLHSIDGRQFGENNVEPEILRNTSLKTQLHLCKFEGSRYGFMMNMTALTIIMQDWEPAIDIIISVRQFYLNKTHQKNKILTLTECYVVSKLCVAFPIYLIRNKHSKINDGQLPTIISSQFQLISGVFMIIRKMIEEGEPYLSLHNTMTSEEIYNYADKHNVFFSEKNKQVCSGSKVKIIELIEFVINGKNLTDTQVTVFQTSLNDKMDEFYHYAMASIELELVTGLSRSISQQLFSTLAKNKSEGMASEILDNLDGYNCQDTNYIDKLNYTIQSYLTILNKNIPLNDQHEFIELITFYETISMFDDNDLQFIIKKYQKILSLTSNYLVFQMNKINRCLGHKIKVKLKNKKIYDIIGVISYDLYMKLTVN